ncbi:hypothetical protein [Limnobacter sp.]|uniref:hypothetical protein n=1 Tax=Limnobacter sp. TaxID=2003368 RepID=UPI003516605E
MKQILNKSAWSRRVFWFLAMGMVAVGIGAPNTGEYLQDRQSEYVQDRALDRISTVNMIMCFMSKLRADAFVNQGEYLALVDEIQCQSDKSRGETTSAGADSAINYVRVLINTTRASNTASQIIRGRLFFTGDGGEQTIFIYAEIQEAPSASSPNGRFNLSFEGYASSDLNTLQSKGMLVASGSEVTFYEQENDNGQGQQTTQLVLQQNGTNTGAGRVRIQGPNNNVDEAFSYSASHYLRGNAGSQSCFDRSRNNAEYSTWRYGVYTQTGSRYVLANPGFALTYTPTSGAFAGRQLWGFAGFYGVFFPEAALAALKADNSAVLARSDSNQTYNLVSANGKLNRLSRVSTTLGNVKGQGIRLFLPSMSGFQQVEVIWNGQQLQRVRSISHNQNGETSTPESGSLSATELRNNNMTVLQGYSPSLGGDVQITVPSTGEFDAATGVVYRVRTVVSPAVADSLNLICISQCPATGSALNDPSTVYQAVNGQQVNYSPVPINPGGGAAPPVQYSFSGGVMQQGGSAVDASSSNGLSNSQFRWGVYSGQMFLASDASSVRCDANGQANPTGTHYCGRQVANLDEVYQYETGPNTWNQYQGLVPVGSTTPITFDPPKKFNFVVSTSNTTLPANDPLIGSTVVLEYQGFGNLHGIPGTCVDPGTNEAVQCGPNTRYVPKFSIVDGTELVDGNTSYFVKYLDREVRFGRVAEATCTGAPNSLSLPLGLSLPSAPTNNVKTLVGSVGANPSSSLKPSVIHGVVQ